MSLNLNKLLMANLALRSQIRQLPFSEVKGEPTTTGCHTVRAGYMGIRVSLAGMYLKVHGAEGIIAICGRLTPCPGLVGASPISSKWSKYSFYT